MVKDNLKFQYINVSSTGRISINRSMTDKKYNLLPDKNGIYKVVIANTFSRFPIFGPKVPLTIQDFEKAISDEIDIWDKDKRNTLLWFVVVGTGYYMAVNYMAYSGLKDPNVKVDANCPHPNSLKLAVIEPTKSGSTPEFTLKAIDGSDLDFSFMNPSKDTLRAYSLSAKENENIVGSTTIASKYFGSVYKRADNTIYPKEAWIGANQLLNEADLGRGSTGLVTYNGLMFGLEGKWSKEFKFDQFSKVNGFDDILSVGDFCAFSPNTTLDMFGIADSFKIGTKFLPLYKYARDKSIQFKSEEKSLSTRDEGSNIDGYPSLRLLALKENALGYIDTNISFKLTTSRYSRDGSAFIYIDDILDLNDGKIAICTDCKSDKPYSERYRGYPQQDHYSTLYKKFNGVVYSKRILKKYLDIADLANVGIEKYLLTSSGGSVVSLRYKINKAQLENISGWVKSRYYPLQQIGTYSSSAPVIHNPPMIYAWK